MYPVISHPLYSHRSCIGINEFFYLAGHDLEVSVPLTRREWLALTVDELYSLQTSAFWVSLSQRWYRSARCSPMKIPQLEHFFFYQHSTSWHPFSSIKRLPLVLWSFLTGTVDYTATLSLMTTRGGNTDMKQTWVQTWSTWVFETGHFFFSCSSKSV